jgi:N-acetylneuraminic acid mutarotase
VLAFSGITVSANAQTTAPNEWTWMGGTSEIGGYGDLVPGVYGELRVPGGQNIPGSRNTASSWIDSNGHLWFFGGQGADAEGHNDLWEFNPVANEWTWMSGSSSSEGPAVYGVLGAPAAANTPGARNGSLSWADKSGHLWLFGGFGLDVHGFFGELNDLWQFDTSSNKWTWIGGGNAIPAVNQGFPGVYGTLGTPDARNTPGAREDAAVWTDSSGNLWLFGGSGEDGDDVLGLLNDLWKFNPSTNEWTWMSGSYKAYQSGVYGTLGMPAAENVPGGRFAAMGWIDSNGLVWIFGGEGQDATVRGGLLNDLWEFNPSTSKWAWMGGATTVGAVGGIPGAYGTLGVPASGNNPGSRSGAKTWKDISGNLWIFGGDGYDSNTNMGYLDDLWEFNPSTNPVQWAWMGGSQTVPDSSSFSGQSGVYGTLGTPAPGNIPGGRELGVSWTDPNGDLWLFGGWGYDSDGNLSDLNDLWKYQPPSSASASPDFSVATSPASLTITAGSSGKTTLLATPANGFNSAVSFTCSGLPAGASCTFSPATVTPSGAAASTTLTITTSATNAALQLNSRPLFPAAALALLVCCFGWRSQRRFLPLWLLAVSMAGLGLIAACGGGGSSGGRSTPPVQPVTTTVTVMATSGSLQHATSVSLTVN